MGEDLSPCQVNQLKEDLSVYKVNNKMRKDKASTEHLSSPKVNLVVDPFFQIATPATLVLLRWQRAM